MKKFITAAALGCLLAKPCIAEDKKINFGYNAAEAAVTDKTVLRTRVLTNVDVGKTLRLGYHGLNETDNFSPDNYFGRHAITLGDKSTMAVAVIKTGGSGVLNHRYGLRSAYLPRKLNGYGFVDITAGKHSADITVFYGKNIGKSVSVELLEDITFSAGKKPVYYTEPQINKAFGKTSIFGRLETTNLERKKTKYMAGIARVF